MNGDNNNNCRQERRERLDELLVTRAVEGIDPGETFELEALLHEFPDVEPAAYDEAAASYWLATGGADEAMPADVAQRMESHLTALAAEGDTGVVAIGHGRRGPAPGSARASTSGPGAVHPAVSGKWGWLAAAAALVLAVVGWWPQMADDAGSEQPASLAEARDRLLAEAPDAVRVEWEETDHPLSSGVTGDVVWSESRQEGYMTFRGIPDNNPAENQYQLWVFDENRSDQYPVDGGVFDAADEEEVVVPIRNKLPVDEAKLFAVTMERSGGVVVSDREDLMWVAKRGDLECPGDKDDGAQEDGI